MKFFTIQPTVEENKKTKNKTPKPGEPGSTLVGDQVQPVDTCHRSLSRKLAEGNGPPADRGACEKQSSTQGSE